MSLEAIEARIAQIADRLNMPPPPPRAAIAARTPLATAPVQAQAMAPPIAAAPQATAQAAAPQAAAPQHSSPAQISTPAVAPVAGASWITPFISGGPGAYIRWFVVLAACLGAWLLLRWVQKKIQTRKKKLEAPENIAPQAQAVTREPTPAPAQAAAREPTSAQARAAAPAVAEVPQAHIAAHQGPLNSGVRPTSLEELLAMRQSSSRTTPVVEVVADALAEDDKDEELDAPPPLVSVASEVD